MVFENSGQFAVVALWLKVHIAIMLNVTILFYPSVIRSLRKQICNIQLASQKPCLLF